MKYPKINTIWKRDKSNKFRIIEGDFSKQEFANILQWHITEKIDGTNIRVSFENDIIKFDGRTDEAQIPAHLYEALQKTFTVSILQDALNDHPMPKRVILYGEGYGAKIQKGGGLYRNDAGFILFDVWIDGWWLERDSVMDIAEKLKIKYVPEIGVMDYKTACDLVKRSMKSIVAEEPRTIEGIVARSHPLMLFRDGTPIMWKLKVRDFDA
jgi:ATP-dependent RNA circularization protein (DNA/RNA ligase family)